MQKTAIFLIIAILLQGLPLAFARTIQENEVWSGFIFLSEDVVVPSDRSLTISPGTHILTNNNKIICYGKVDIQGEKANQVRFLPSISLGTAEIAVLQVKPYNINTQILKDEFQTFKIQYAILWSVLFGSIFFTLESTR